MSQNNRTMKTSVLIRRFLPFFRKYKWPLILDLFCATLTTVCELVLPLIIRDITNTALYDVASLTVRYVVRLGVLYIVLRLIDAAANFYMSTGAHVMGANMERDMRASLFDHLQKLGFAYYSNAKVGSIMSRITSDLFEVTEFAHHCPEEFFIGAIKIVVPFVILMGTSWQLTLIIFAVLPIMLVTTRFFNKKMRDTFMESRIQVGELNAQVEDSLLGIRVVKSFANEDIEKDKFSRGNEKFLEIARRKYFWMGTFGTFTRVFEGIMYILVVLLGALFIISGQIKVPDYIAYLLYVSTLLTSIRRIVDYMEQFQRGLTGIERYMEIIDEVPDITDAPDAKELKNVRGDVAFENVAFRYSDGEDNSNVLENISFSVKAGERIALVGPSGGGKTTLCNLIPRFYDVTNGTIRVDGQDIRTLTQHSLRENIGMVQQDVYMFSGTVFENISYGMPNATREQVEEAARLAGAHDFICELPSGYDTYVGERGVKLSGGQKQRISIARVFLKNPPILILDEATSALDNESERLVQESLEKLSKGRTTFTIAHRLTTIRNATRIWVLTENGIEEEGSHKELMAKGGLYSHLYNMYTEVFEE